MSHGAAGSRPASSWTRRRVRRSPPAREANPPNLPFSLVLPRSFGVLVITSVACYRVGGDLSIAGYGSEVAKWKELLLPIARGEGAAPLSPTERAKFFFGVLDGSEEQADEYLAAFGIPMDAGE